MPPSAVPSDLPPHYVFDLDGTLVDTAPDLLHATNAVLAAEGRTAIAPDNLRELVGMGAAALIAQAFAATGAPVDEARLPELVGDFVRHYRTHIAHDSTPYPRVIETLERLKAEGARMAVLTNKPHELAVMLLEALDMQGYFAAVFGAGRMSYTKPDARIFHDVIEAMGGGGLMQYGSDMPAVMVGDSITDLKTARAAGVKVILVDYGYTSEPVRGMGADAVTGDFAEVPGLAARLFGRA